MNFLDNFSTLKNKSGIYKISCNKHFYIGSSKNLKSRMIDHKKILKANRHYNKFIQRVYDKYGFKKMEISILEFCEIDILTEREQYYYDLLQPNLNGTSDIKRNIVIQKLRSNQKPVHQYNLDGNYIESYDNATLAANKYRIKKQGICAAANPNLPQIKAFRGYQWSYIRLDSISKYVNNSYTHRLREVTIYNIKGNKIQTYKSIADAARDLISKHNLNVPFDSLCASISSSCKHNNSKIFDNFRADFKNVEKLNIILKKGSGRL